MEQGKKYEILRNFNVNINGRDVYKIRALRDVGTVPAGTLGGYVESEANLSHKGDCWIANSAIACGDSRVSGNARLLDEAKLFDQAAIRDEATVAGQAELHDFASAEGQATVSDRTMMRDHSKVRDNAVVSNGRIVLKGHSSVAEDAVVEGKTRLENSARVEGQAHVKHTVLNGKSLIDGNANVTSAILNDNAHITNDAVVTACAFMRENAVIDGTANVETDINMSGQARITGGKITDFMDIDADALIENENDYMRISSAGIGGCAFRCRGGDVKMRAPALGMPFSSSFNDVSVRMDKMAEYGRIKECDKEALMAAMDEVRQRFGLQDASDDQDFANAVASIPDEGVKLEH